MTVAEIVGMEGDVITMQDLFVFDRRGVGEGGRVLGEFKPTGIRPRFADRLARYGILLDKLLFSEQPSRTAAVEEW
jgi:pilus assembly protein CpaF